MKQEILDEITEEISKLLKRIRRKLINPKILLFGDLNTNKNSKIESSNNSGN